jgi:hypothetical protein
MHTSCPHWFEPSAGCVLRKPDKGFIAPNPPLQTRTLLLNALEITRELANRGKTVFHAQGTCMYPTVRPGDVLHIESRTVEKTALGDISVCRGPGYLFGHRVIGKGVHLDRPYILTRPDRTRQGDDGPTYDKDLLGVVVSLERKGRRLPVPKQPHSQPMGAYRATWVRLYEYALHERFRLSSILALVQQRTAYRRLAGRWLTITGTNTAFDVRLPFRAHRVHDVYSALSPEDFDPAATIWQGRPVFFWTLALVCHGNKRPAADADFVLRPPECAHAGWWLHDLRVRVRYRGIGLETDLIRQAETILARGGARLRGVGVP